MQSLKCKEYVLLKKYCKDNYLIEMSSSWNFPARRSPSYEGSEPSRAEPGHFNFQAETELTILTIYKEANFSSNSKTAIKFPNFYQYI